MRWDRTVLLFSVAAVVAVAAQEKQPPPPPQPTFRTGVNLVRVDAYPSRDGKIVAPVVLTRASSRNLPPH